MNSLRRRVRPFAAPALATDCGRNAPAMRRPTAAAELREALRSDAMTGDW